MAASDDDRALVRAAQSGDRRALDRLLRDQYDRVHAVCRRITNNEADAADATQEAMIAIVRGLPSFDGRSSFGTWTYRIATNASLDELRRRKRRPATSLDRRDDSDGPGGGWNERADPTALVSIDQLGDREALEAALADLPEEFRVPVVLRDVADLDYAEIANILDVPLGTVKSRIARGRSALATMLIRTSGNQVEESERPTNTP